MVDPCNVICGLTGNRHTQLTGSAWMGLTYQRDIQCTLYILYSELSDSYQTTHNILLHSIVLTGDHTQTISIGTIKNWDGNLHFFEKALNCKGWYSWFDSDHTQLLLHTILLTFSHRTAYRFDTFAKLLQYM